MDEQREDRELGALWIKQGRNGDTFFAGKINGIDVVVFKNERKQKETQPDYRVLRGRRGE